jgi:hypothetical protein
MQSRSSPYPGFAPSLLDQAEKHLRPLGFSFHSPAFRGALFTNPDTSQAVLLDHRICDTRYPFAYTLYTKEQNALMHKYRGVFRFMADTRDDLADAARTLDRLLNREFAEDSIQTKGRHRHWHDIDPTMPEALFEQAFIDCYGRRALDRVIREFPVIDMNGHTRWWIISSGPGPGTWPSKKTGNGSTTPSSSAKTGTPASSSSRTRWPLTASRCSAGPSRA